MPAGWLRSGEEYWFDNYETLAGAKAYVQEGVDSAVKDGARVTLRYAKEQSWPAP